MKKSVFLIQMIISFLFLSMISCVGPREKAKESGTTYHLYFAGGQSNLEGFGFNKDLSEKYKSIDSNVMIFCGNQEPDDTEGGGLGKWLPLSPGYGTGFYATQDSVFLSDRFGPELSFGKHIAELTKEPVAIIKYARGGSSIALGASGYGTWAKEYHDNTTINQWDHFYQTVQNAFHQKDIDGDGLEDTLIPSGIIWMQGEADAYVEESSKVYLENITQLMKDITEVFGVEQLPIVICRIEDSGITPEERKMAYIEAVWEAQEKYAVRNEHVEMIHLDQPIEFLEDAWHYKSQYYIEMGNKFAEKLNAPKP